MCRARGRGRRYYRFVLEQARGFNNIETLEYSGLTRSLHQLVKEITMRGDPLSQKGGIGYGKPEVFRSPERYSIPQKSMNGERA